MKILYCWADSFAAVINLACDCFAKAINKVSGCFININMMEKALTTLQLLISSHLQDTATGCTSQLSLSKQKKTKSTCAWRLNLLWYLTTVWFAIPGGRSSQLCFPKDNHISVTHYCTELPFIRAYVDKVRRYPGRGTSPKVQEQPGLV